MTKGEKDRGINKAMDVKKEMLISGGVKKEKKICAETYSVSC